MQDARHDAVILRCEEAIGRWTSAVEAGIGDAQDVLYRRHLLPLQIKVIGFRADAATEEAVRLSTCVAVCRAAVNSNSWPKVICEGDALRIVWGPEFAEER